jgi:hypothetical protein
VVTVAQPEGPGEVADVFLLIAAAYLAATHESVPVANRPPIIIWQPPPLTMPAPPGIGPIIQSSGNPPVPSNPATPPGPGWVWKGNGAPGSKEGAWHNPSTGESLHPDLTHPTPIGPHWDYRDPTGKDWRIFPDGRKEPK